MVEIDLQRAELVLKSLQEDRDRKFPKLSKDEKRLSDRKLMDAVLEGALAWERKVIERQNNHNRS